MREFKVGDQVRVVDASHSPLVLGQKYCVIDLDRGNVKVDGSPRWWYPHRFELVEAEDTLEQLVAKANEGLKAIGELNRTHFDKIEQFYRPSNTWCSVYSSAGSGDIRIKPKPTFTPFETSNGWKVHVEGDRFHIGCLSFKVKGVLLCLEFLTKQDGSTWNGFSETVVVNRNGVKYKSYTLPWADAEKILSELEKVSA